MNSKKPKSEFLALHLLQTNKVMPKENRQIGFFEKYLTIWVALCIVGGILLGRFDGESVELLSKLEIF